MNISKKVTIILPTFLLSAIAISSVAFLKPSIAEAKQFPAEILDLKNWKQTLPFGNEESPTEIKNDKLKQFSQNPFFQINSMGDGVQFRAPVNGVTTSGSGYPRSELREMTNDGKENASWSTTSGIHVMYIDEAITALPKSKKHIVAGQIHDAKDDVIVIRLEDKKLFVDINGKPGPVLDADYELGKRFTIKFQAGKGVINVYYNGSEKPAYSLEKKGNGNYFKAGAYTQSNCSKESVCDDSNYGEVMVYDLKLAHGDSNVILPTSDASQKESEKKQENNDSENARVEEKQEKESMATSIIKRISFIGQSLIISLRSF